jgi:hypothetical protein
MIRRLIILLLIVGCGTEPEDSCDVCDVSWIIASDSSYSSGDLIENEPKLYYTNFIPPSERDCTVVVDGDTLHFPTIQGVLLVAWDSVRVITHFAEPNYFELIDLNSESRTYFPNDYETFKYGYK